VAASFLILGGGIAGTFLAARLCLQGQSVTLVDERHPRSASRVAAGMFNVITGRFGAKSWLADDLLAEIQSCLEQPFFQPFQRFVHYQEIYRPFRQEGEYNKWQARSVNPVYAHLVQLEEQPLFPDQIHNPLGGIRILPCGWTEIGPLIDAMQERLVANHGLQLLREPLPYSAIDLTQRKVQTSQGSWQGDQLIIATGQEMATCPWLPTGSIIPNKGEILLVEAPELNLPFLLSKKVYLLPHGEGRYITGSTYANQFDHPNPTPAAREEILRHLQAAIKLPVRVLDQWAGLRPTTPNRRPLVGTHPAYPFLHFLGGFGTKGMLLAPFTSRLLTEQLLQGKAPIPTEANLSRFFT
jgi:glycine oxidase